MPSLPDLFQIVRVEPFERVTALSVIDRQLEATASGPGVEVERGTGERIVRLFRRFMPALRVGGAGLDLSPMVATFVLIIVGRIVVTLSQG